MNKKNKKTRKNILSKELIRPAGPGPAEARDPANGSLFIDRIYAQTISTSNITADDFTVIQVTSHNIWRAKNKRKNCLILNYI
jgi:hypothetical protein